MREAGFCVGGGRWARLCVHSLITSEALRDWSSDYMLGGPRDGYPQTLQRIGAPTCQQPGSAPLNIPILRITDMALGQRSSEGALISADCASSCQKITGRLLDLSTPPVTAPRNRQRRILAHILTTEELLYFLEYLSVDAI